MGFLLSFLPSTWAIEGGKSATSENVVSFVLRNPVTGTLSLPTCSGGMISPRIVVTAKHCVEGYNSSITWLINKNWEVTYPGTDIESKSLITARIVNIIARPGEFSTQDDIALIVIDRDFPLPVNLRVANAEDMTRLRNLEASSITYGYGSTATSNLQTYLPYKIENKLVRDFPDRSWGQEVFAIKYLSSSAYICGGDSGGPNIIESGGYSYYIGPTGFATRPGCAKGLEGNFHSGGTAIAYKTDLLSEAEMVVEKMKTDELRAAAELKAQQEEMAKAAAELKARQEAEAKAAAELKAKQEAEAAAKLAANKKTTITCINGKLTKKVTALKPKCPTGYKVKK
jgi:V8-like Glu-specific endopeptidase